MCRERSQEKILDVMYWLPKANHRPEIQCHLLHPYGGILDVHFGSNNSQDIQIGALVYIQQHNLLEKPVYDSYFTFRSPFLN